MSETGNHASAETPVTIYVKRSIKPNLASEFEEWLKGATADLSRFPGYMDITVIRPAASAPVQEYVLLIRFDNLRHVQEWEGSDVRNAWMEKAKPFTLNLENQKVTGLEYWFQIPEMPKSAVPPRHKMVAVTILAIFPVTTLLGLYVAPYINAPFLIKGLIMTAITVLIMTYAVMPFMVSLFKGWLFKRT